MKAVCLDMDGTLVDSERLWDIAVYELAEHMGKRLDPATRAKTMGVSLDGFFRILGEYTGRRVVGPERQRLTELLNGRMRELMRSELEWRPGALDLLDDLAASRVPLALVTNTSADVAVDPINFIGRARFDVIVTADDVVRAKPAPEPYITTCRLLGVEPRSAVAVEDSVTGATSAVAAGCRVLQVPSRVGQGLVEGSSFHETLVGVDSRMLNRLTAEAPSSAPVGESAP